MRKEDLELVLEIMEREQKDFEWAQRHLPPPKYKKGDIVKFDFNKGEEPLQGMIEIVDRYGTFDQNEEPSYDIYRFENNTLYKHIRESLVVEFIREGSLEEIEENIKKFF